MSAVPTRSNDAPPRLSELGLDLLKLSSMQVVRAVSLPFLMFGAYWIFAILGYWIPTVLSLVVLSFVTYGSTSHDLVHRTLGLKPWTNDILLSVLEAISLRSGHAYQAAHLNHHARFPHDDDIEALAARMSLLRALLEGVIFQGRIYLWALKNAPTKKMWIVGEGIAVATLIMAAIAAMDYSIVPIVYVGLMIAGSWIIPLVTSYLPHDAKAQDVLHQTRLFRGLAIRLIAADHLYHLEHHLYPAVPHQKWPTLAKRLDPWLEEQNIQPIRVGF